MSNHRKKLLLGLSTSISISLAFFALASVRTKAAPEQGNPGKVRFLLRTDPTHDPFLSTGNPADQEWIRTHWWRMMVYVPYFDSRTRWYPNALVYKDATGLDSKKVEVPQRHPDWFLKDSAGNILYIQYNCKPSENKCSHFAADPGSPAYRHAWIEEARNSLSRGYKGLWIDDVNMSWRISNGRGEFVNPVDPRTSQLMTEDDWRRYVAEFMEEVRRELPDIEIVHNAIWFGGPKGIRDRDESIRREYASADYINNEHGVSEKKGEHGGTGEWSIEAKLQYYDRVHAMGKGVIVDEVSDESNAPEGRNYTLAVYYLITNGSDALGNQKMRNSREWWVGYDIDMGTPLGPRKMWKGMYRRDFTGGIVVLNPPKTEPKSFDLPATFLTPDGVQVRSVSLGPAEGAALRRSAGDR
jgi:Hypothetical glycosyl hydrolase family 15